MIAGTGFRIADIDEAWPRWRARAERSRAQPEHLEWVCQQCRADDALCLECDDGIVVVTLRPKTNALVVLFAAGVPGAFKRREAELFTVAREIGASSVTFRTDRRAWPRVLGEDWTADGDDRFRRAA